MTQSTPAGPTGPAYDPATGLPYPAPVPPKQRSWFVRHKILTGLGVLVALVVLATASQGGGKPASGAQPADQPAATASMPSAEPTSAQPTTEPAAAGAAIGTPVRDGKFEFTVTQVETGVTRVGDDILGKDAQGQFVLVHLTVSNIGSKAQYFDGSSQVLRDTAGRTFSADSTAGIYLDKSNSFLNQINPGNTVQGIVAFDVPVDAVLKTAELHDSAFSSGVTVSLG